MDERYDMDNELSESEPGLKRISQAIAVVDELGNLKEYVNRHEELGKNSQGIIEIATEAFFKIADVGLTQTARVDLQSHQADLTAKEASLESLDKTIERVWRGIVDALKRAWNWLKGVVARIMGLEKKTTLRLERLDDLTAQSNELRMRISSRTKVLPKPVSFNYDPVMQYFFEKDMTPTKASKLSKVNAELKTLADTTGKWGIEASGDMFFTRKVAAKVDFTKGSKIVEMSEDLGGWRMFRTAPEFPAPKGSDVKFHKILATWVRANEFRVDNDFNAKGQQSNVIELDIAGTNFKALHHELSGYSDTVNKARAEVRVLLKAMEDRISSIESKIRNTNYQEKGDEEYARNVASYSASVFSKLSLGPLVVWTRRLDAIVFSAVRLATDFAQIQVDHLERQAASLQS